MIKHIQINVEGFRYFDALLHFLNQERPDIINFQEATDGDFWDTWEQKDYLEILSQQLDMQLISHLTMGREFSGGVVSTGVAVLSRYPIIDFTKGVLDGSEPRIYPNTYPLFTEEKKYQKYKYAFHLPLWYINCVLDIDGIYMRNITAHYHVGYACYETEKHITDTETILRVLQESKPLPTIFSGDLNLRTGTASLDMLSEAMQIHTADAKNTLNKNIHPLFINEPGHEGLPIDHVFSLQLQHESTQGVQVDVSDHYPVVSTFWNDK